MTSSKSFSGWSLSVYQMVILSAHGGFYDTKYLFRTVIISSKSPLSLVGFILQSSGLTHSICIFCLVCLGYPIDTHIYPSDMLQSMVGYVSQHWWLQIQLPFCWYQMYFNCFLILYIILLLLCFYFLYS